MLASAATTPASTVMPIATTRDRVVVAAAVAARASALAVSPAPRLTPRLLRPLCDASSGTTASVATSARRRGAVISGQTKRAIPSAPSASKRCAPR